MTKISLKCWEKKDTVVFYTRPQSNFFLNPIRLPSNRFHTKNNLKKKRTLRGILRDHNETNHVSHKETLKQKKGDIFGTVFSKKMITF